MMILISCAKTMSPKATMDFPEKTRPLFAENAAQIALYMSQYSIDELENMLHVNSKIALDNHYRFQSFHGGDQDSLPALLAYTGVVFKHLNPKTLTGEQIKYAQDHLRITSFLYGLLRPCDLIQLYRLEGNVTIPELGNETLYDYWKPRLTDLFIREIKENGGTLVNLASDEMKSLFDWKRLTKEVTVVTPEFKTAKDGKLKTIVIYTKMCRGEMTRFIIDRQIKKAEDLKAFSWEGFELNESLSRENNPVFTNGIIL